MLVLAVVERGLPDAIRQALEREGHSISLAHSEDRAVQMAKALAFDAIVVDDTPALNGFKIARSLAKAGSLAPILLLISKDAVRRAGKVTEAGVDDFLVKPFALAEFTARLRTISARGRGRRLTRFQIADLTLDASTHEVFRGETPVALTRKEFQLLEILIRNAGRLVRRGDLIDALWGGAQNVETNTLDAFIRLLRRKIDRGRKVKLLHTVRGFGYRLSDQAK